MRIAHQGLLPHNPMQAYHSNSLKVSILEGTLGLLYSIGHISTSQRLYDGRSPLVVQLYDRHQATAGALSLNAAKHY